VISSTRNFLDSHFHPEKKRLPSPFISFMIESTTWQLKFSQVCFSAIYLFQPKFRLFRIYLFIYFFFFQFYSFRSSGLIGLEISVAFRFVRSACAMYEIRVVSNKLIRFSLRSVWLLRICSRKYVLHWPLKYTDSFSLLRFLI
jgi:hypothetical protein